MKRSGWLWLLLAVSVSVASFAGDIQVSCEPDVRVYLDGDLMGVSSVQQDGLFLANVKAGMHTVRVERDGFVARSYEVEVGDSPIEVKVERLQPDLGVRSGSETSEAETRQPKGTLVVTSAPQNCTVEIDGRAETKNTPEMVIEDLAEGEHRISFSKQGYDPISGVVRLQQGAEVTVRGDLIAGKVETVYEGKGSLRVISTPEHCAVRLLGMTKEKTSAVLNISHLPAGEHRLVVACKGREASSNVVIMDGQRTVVRVNLLKRGQLFHVSYEPE